MASRQGSVKSLRKSFNSLRDKENKYLHVLRDYQTRVRRRETLRSTRSVLVSFYQISLIDHCCVLPVAFYCLHFTYFTNYLLI